MGYLLELRKVVGKRTVVTVGASVIISNEENKILLIHRKDNDLWGLPAGSTEINEHPEETAVREVLEETGICLKRNDLTLIQVFGGEEFFYIYPNGDKCSNVVISYGAKVENSSVVTNTTETKNAVWCDSSNLPLNIANHELVMINYFLKNK